MKIRRIGTVILAATALWMLNGLSGCSEDAAPIYPGAAACVIQGRVSTSGVVSSLGVRARQVLPAGASVDYTVPVSETGAYRAELPAGDYLLSAYVDHENRYLTPDGLLSWRRADADTLRLHPGNSPFTADLLFGGLRVEAAFPSRMDGATVYLQIFEAGSDDLVSYTSVTTEGGRFDLNATGLPSGDYYAQIGWRLDYEHPGWTSWLPNTRDRGQARVYHVSPDAATPAYTSFGSTWGRVTGHVGGAWLALGLSAPRLSAVAADSLTVAGPWIIEEDGSFDFPVPAQVPVRLAVECGGVRQWVGGPDFGGATVFAPASGQIVTGVEVGGGGLRLRVVAGALVPGYDWARLSLHRPGEPDAAIITSGDLSRQIGIANLPAGDWLLHVGRENLGSTFWRPQWLDRAANAADATVLTIPAAGVLTVDLVLEAGGAIRGQFIRPSGNWHWAYLTITSADEAINLGYDEIRIGVQDFAFTGLADGRYKVGLVLSDAWPRPGDPPPAETVWYPATTDWTSAGVVVIDDAGTVEGLVIPAP